MVATRAGGTERELRARGQRMVQRLLDAGIEVFDRKGYHATRVDDIVKTARTSHGTFYLYFANKEDLFKALAVQVADEVRGLVDSLGPLSADEEGFAELRSWIASFAALHQRFGPVIKAWTDAEIDGTEVGQIGTDVLGGLVTALALRTAAAAPPGLDPALAALALVAMVERAHYYALTGQLRVANGDLIDLLARIAFTALFGAGASRR